MTDRGKGQASRKWALISGLVVLAIATILLLAYPRTTAALRWKPGFDPLTSDPRVFFEPGASTAAQQFADALPEALARVEETHGLPFVGDFRLYICSTHQSFVGHLDLPRDSPVRGMVMRDIWLSPLVFDFHGRDTHRESLAHELSHLHVRQHLGWRKSVQGIPTWFAEGLADVAADTGGEIFTRQMALSAFAEGRHFVPDAYGRFPIPRGLLDYGVPAPLLHQQSRMFVEYLQADDPTGFRSFVVEVLHGAAFPTAFQERFERDLDRAWQDFLRSLE